MDERQTIKSGHCVRETNARASINSIRGPDVQCNTFHMLAPVTCLSVCLSVAPVSKGPTPCFSWLPVSFARCFSVSGLSPIHALRSQLHGGKFACGCLETFDEQGCSGLTQSKDIESCGGFEAEYSTCQQWGSKGLAGPVERVGVPCYLACARSISWKRKVVEPLQFFELHLCLWNGIDLIMDWTGVLQ